MKTKALKRKYSVGLYATQYLVYINKKQPPGATGGLYCNNTEKRPIPPVNTFSHSTNFWQAVIFSHFSNFHTWVAEFSAALHLLLIITTDSAAAGKYSNRSYRLLQIQESYFAGYISRQFPVPEDQCILWRLLNSGNTALPFHRTTKSPKCQTD